MRTPWRRLRAARSRTDAGAMRAGGGDENCAIEGLKATFGEHVTLPVYPAAMSAAQ